MENLTKSVIKLETNYIELCVIYWEKHCNNGCYLRHYIKFVLSANIVHCNTPAVENLTKSVIKLYIVIYWEEHCNDSCYLGLI